MQHIGNISTVKYLNTSGKHVLRVQLITFRLWACQTGLYHEAHTCIVFKKSFRSTLWSRELDKVAQRGDLEVGSQKTGEGIREGENPERVTPAKGRVVEVSLSSASFLPQTKSYLHFPAPFPWACDTILLNIIKIPTGLRLYPSFCLQGEITSWFQREKI